MRPQCDGSFFLRSRTAGANFYNVFNHPNFANPVNGISSGQWHDPIHGGAIDESIRRIRWIRRFRPAHPIDHSFDL